MAMEFAAAAEIDDALELDAAAAAAAGIDDALELPVRSTGYLRDPDDAAAVDWLFVL